MFCHAHRALPREYAELSMPASRRVGKAWSLELARQRLAFVCARSTLASLPERRRTVTICLRWSC
eukprot:5800020-Pyramimonas_sp.AAC.1